MEDANVQIEVVTTPPVDQPNTNVKILHHMQFFKKEKLVFTINARRIIMGSKDAVLSADPDQSYKAAIFDSDRNLLLALDNVFLLEVTDQFKFDWCNNELLTKQGAIAKEESNVRVYTFDVNNAEVVYNAYEAFDCFYHSGCQLKLVKLVPSIKPKEGSEEVQQGGILQSCVGYLLAPFQWFYKTN